MKTLRLLGVALFTMLMNVSFSACGGSDEEDDNGGGGNTPLVSKRLAKVTTQEGNSTFSDEFTYDSNGRVVKVVNKKNGNNSGHIIYTYTDNLIVKKQYYTGSSSVSETQYELENGLIDVEEAIRTMNPDMDEEALQAKIEKAIQNRQSLLLQEQTEFNDEGGFE